MKKFIFGMLTLLFTTAICFAAKPVGTYKGCQKLAAKHNMTVITETENMFYAECKNPLSEQKFYVLYYTENMFHIEKKYKALDVKDVKILCYYIDGEFYSDIIAYPYEDFGNFTSGKITISLLNERAILKNSQGASIYITSYGIEMFTAMLKYLRADLLIRFNKDLGIFIPDNKKKEYQLDDVDELNHKLDALLQ